MKKLLKSDSSYKVFSSTSAFPNLIELGYRGEFDTSNRTDIMSEYGLRLCIEEIVDYYIKNRKLPKIDFIDMNKYFGLDSFLFYHMCYCLPYDYLKPCLEKKGIEYDRFLSKEPLQFHTFAMNPKYSPTKDMTLPKFNILEKEKREFLLTCHDNVQTNSLKALIKDHKSIEKIKNYLKKNGYECVILEEATVYERINPNYIETVMISKKEDGYIVSTKLIYSKINKDGCEALINRIESDIVFSKGTKKCASDVKNNHNLELYKDCYLEIMNMILDYQILETVLVHSKLSSTEYSLNTSNVIRNFGGTDGIIRLIHNLSELSNQYSIKDYLEPIHLKSNTSKMDIVASFFNRNKREDLQDMMDPDYYCPMKKHNLFEEYKEEIRIEKESHSDIWKQVYFYFFEQGCNVRFFEETHIHDCHSSYAKLPKYRPTKMIEQILEQEYFPDTYGIAYILTKMQKGDFRFISCFNDNYDDIILCSRQYPQSMIELVSKYQKFISYCSTKESFMLWGKDEVVAKEMGEYIFGLFGMREGKMELAKDMYFIYYQLATSNRYGKKKKIALDFSEFNFDRKLTGQLLENFIYDLRVEKTFWVAFQKVKDLKNNGNNKKY